MADNAIVSNAPTSINTDIPVRSIEKTGQQTQVVTLDLGGSGAENLVSGAIPVSLSGVSTELTLSALNAKVIEVDTGAVAVISSVLPTDASTASNQVTLLAALGELDSKIVTCDTAGSATEARQDDILGALERLTRNLINPPHIDKSLNRVRETAIIESGTVTTVTTVTTCTTLTNLAGFAGYQSQLLALDTSRLSWACNVRARFT